MISGWHLPVPARGGAAVRAMAARILSERQFQQSQDLWQRFINWVNAHILGVHVPGLFGGTWPNYLALAVLVAAAGAVLFLALRHASVQRLWHPKSPGVVVTESDETLSPGGWRQEAERLAGEGQYREALRCRYRGLVAELAQRRLVDEVPGRTSGDYERVVRALLPKVADQFSSVTRLFERCWYGHEASDAQAQVVFDEAAKTVLAELDAGRWKALAHDAERRRDELVGLQ